MATKTATARLRLQAHNRLTDAIHKIAKRVDALEALDLNPRRKQNRMKADHADAQELDAIATFVEALVPYVGGEGANAELAEKAKALSDELDAQFAKRQEYSDRLSVLRLLLDTLLHEKTKAELEQFAEDFALEIDPTARKDDIITSFCEQLTGKRLIFVPEDEAPDDTYSVREAPGLKPYGVEEGQVGRLVDVDSPLFDDEDAETAESTDDEDGD